MALLDRDQEDSRAWLFLGGADLFPYQISAFQYFCLFPVDNTIYSAIFQYLVYFQGVDWGRRGRSLSLAHVSCACPGFSLMPCLPARQWVSPPLHPEPPQLCLPAELSLCFLQSEGLGLLSDFSTSLWPSTIIPAGPSQEIGETNRPFSYQNLLCRPLECKFLHSAKSFTTLLSSLFSRNQWKYYFVPYVYLTFLHLKFVPLEIYLAI